MLKIPVFGFLVLHGSQVDQSERLDNHALSLGCDLWEVLEKRTAGCFGNGHELCRPACGVKRPQGQAPVGSFRCPFGCVEKAHVISV